MRFEELQSIFNGQVYFMGYLSDTAVFNHLMDCTFLAAFFEKGLRANNTTVNAAMECGCAVITNLDEHSPAGLVHMKNVIDINLLRRLPDAGRRRERIGRAARDDRARRVRLGSAGGAAAHRASSVVGEQLVGRERLQAIGAHEIGDDTPCYVIAEIGHNHQGSLEKARELFREAKLAGAHAVKLQKRDNRGLYTQAAYDKPYDNENSFGATYGEHREFLEFGAHEYRELQAYAKELGVDFFSTAFDIASADFLAGARRAGLQDRLGRPEEHAAAEARGRASASR